MSSCDGWPVYFVDVEHLSARSMRLWLREGPSRTLLRTIDTRHRMGLVVADLVVDHLGLTDPNIYADLNWIQPSFVHDGDRVIAIGGGHLTDGIVRRWIEGEASVPWFTGPARRTRRRSRSRTVRCRCR